MSDPPSDPPPDPVAAAVVPIERFREKFGDLSGVGIAARIGELAEQFLSDHA